MTAIRSDITIIGNGLAGMSLALSLRNKGLKIMILDHMLPEKMFQDHFDGRTTALAYATKKLYEAIGIWQQLEPFCEPIWEIRVSDSQLGKKESPFFLHFDSHEEDDKPCKSEPMGYIIENRYLKKILWAQIESSSDIQILAPVTVKNIMANNNESIIELTNKTTIHALLTVGADGRNAHSRQLLQIAVQKSSYPQSAIVCTVSHEASHQNIAHEKFLPNGPFAILPMQTDEKGNHRSSIVWSENSDIAEHMITLDDDAFVKQLHFRLGDFLGKLTLISQKWSYPLTLIHAKKYIAQRFCLIGDAAHAIHPIAGQGFNLGIRDVASLAELIINIHKLGLDIGNDRLVKDYEKWRKFDNLLLIKSTDFLNHLFSNNNKAIRLVRDMGMGIVNNTPPLKRFFMQYAMGKKPLKILKERQTPQLLLGKAL